LRSSKPADSCTDRASADSAGVSRSSAGRTASLPDRPAPGASATANVVDFQRR
jgi:hypothetical protein